MPELRWTPPLTILRSRSEGAEVVAAIGEIDLSTVDSLRAALADATATTSVHSVVVDFSRVEFLATCGLNELIVAQQSAKQCGLRFLLVAPGRAVRRPLLATGLDQELSVHNSVADALAGTGSHAPRSDNQCVR